MDRKKSEGSKSIVDKSRLVDESGLNSRIVSFVTKWEFILVVLLLLEIVVFSNLTPHFLNTFNLLNTTFTFSEKAILALPMIFIILSGDIDISVAGIMALSSFAMGYASSQGAGTGVLVLIGLCVGVIAGFFNGLLVTGLNMPAIAVTLASMTLFRGISQAILEDQAYTEYPEKFGYFGQGYIGDSMVPFELVLFLVLAVIMGFVLHKTTYGRKLYAIGNSSSAANFSGISVNKVRLTNFVLNGLFAGIAAVLLTSRIGSTRPNIATGFELEVITLVVLGGVSITGGKGNIFGVVLAIFLLGYLKFGMGLLNISAKVMIITTGALLIIAVLIPGFMDSTKARNKLKRQQNLETTEKNLNKGIDE
ncbi:MAG: ABC transporter permease [Spirochaetes bacterium]|nr:MAG: ABC transporter permease [Spirochaetota bacterium]